MNRMLCFSTFVFFFVSMQALAKEAQPAFNVHKTSHNSFVLTRIWSETSKANIGVVITDKGVVLINTLMNNDIELLQQELNNITDLPVRYVINSNWDTYNHQANEYFANKGATIIGHENLRYRPVYRDVTFKEAMTLEMGNERIRLVSSPAHSFGHINVYLEKANMVFMADSYRNDWMTITGPQGIDGHLRGIQSVLAWADDATVIVTGNTLDEALSTKADLREEIAMRNAFNDRVTTLFERGFELDAITSDEKIQSFFSKNYPNRAFSPKSKIIHLLQTDLIQPFAISPSSIEQIVGQYKSPGGQLMEIVYENNQFLAKSEQKFITSLLPREENTFEFVAATKGEKLIFELNQKGRIVAVIPQVENSYYRYFIEAGKWKKVGVSTSGSF